ncbi:hypothetical protein HQ576_01195, partial [bacterium]|nr:hypothetical protein [bacterium]
NARFAVAHVHDRVRVLCVDGDPSTQPFKGETGYLAAALSPKRSESLEAKIVPWLELPSQRLADYNVVVLANLPDIRQSLVRGLAAFVRGGGGLIIFLGDKTVPPLFNARMDLGKGESLLPAKLGEVRGAPRDSDGWPIATVLTEHPLARALQPLPRDLMSRATVDRFITAQPAKGAHTVLGLTGADAPFLIERPMGQGTVLLFTSTADRAWTDFIVHPAGPILLNQAVTYLTRQANERPFTVGEPLVVPLPDRDVAQTVVFRDPNGKATPVQPTQRNGGRMAESPATESAGFHEIQQNGSGIPLAAAVNVDPIEADVKCLHGTALTQALTGLPVRVLSPDADILATIKQSRVGYELWRILMVLALLVLLVESYLAHRFSRRMAIREDVLAAEAPEDLLAEPEPAEA